MKSNYRLYLLATPIGNLNEANPLLIKMLESLSVLFCEDTRITNNLLSLLNIKNKPKLISYHKFNENEKINTITHYLQEADCGLISDAGYPTICDPGYKLVQWCHQHHINVAVVNGSCAINHAIAQSGFCSQGFIFIGFINKKQQEIITTLNHYLKANLPIVFFVSVHQITNLIDVLKKYYKEHEIYIGRELTKKYETYFIGKVSNIDTIVEKGEFCCVLKPLVHEQENEVNYLDEIESLLSCNIKINDACKYLAKKFKLNKNTIYNEYLKHKKS